MADVRYPEIRYLLNPVIMKSFSNSLVSFCLALLLSLLTIQVQASETRIIKAVGTWEYFTNYQEHEGPFWNEHIAKVSKGEIVGEIKPHTQLGLQGYEIMRLVKNGVFDFAFGLPGYVVPESEIFEGADLSSLVQNIDVQKKVAEAYFPTLELAFAEKYNAKLMMLYPFHSQMIWCNKEIRSITDLKGKRIRVFLSTLGDFVEGVGAIPVSASFNDVPKALEKGIFDCAITGTMSAYTGELYKVADYGYTLRVGWGLAFGAMNLNKWNLLTSEQKALLQSELAALSEKMWNEIAKEDAMALACLAKGPCEMGEVGNMTLVTPSRQDLEVRTRVAREVILPRWANRCGPDCAANWNHTVGKLLDLRAETQPR
ncbi:putative transport protein [Oceanospirillum sp. MED92]|uniref:Putative transport protein n=2 Tax=Neptuniibacter caesariensis TaxID=207954 RepID=A0A7U8C5I0_NEPCE|nr:putative transport protein [Oceanospirillum sp. MED92] [Neptuniibacter caesariensis]